MKACSPATRLTIYLSNGDLWQHRPLGDVIMERARDAGLNGASLFEGLSGFGPSATPHRRRPWVLVSSHPLAITIVDREERVRAFLDTLDELLTDAVATLEGCEMIRYYRDGGPGP